MSSTRLMMVVISSSSRRTTPVPVPLRDLLVSEAIVVSTPSTIRSPSVLLDAKAA